MCVVCSSSLILDVVIQRFFLTTNIYPYLSPEDPALLPRVQIDRGAIRFILAGANMMCPGFTSKGGSLPPASEAVAAEKPVAIYAEGKEHAVGLGLLKLSTEDIKKVNKGVGVEVTTYLGDDLWSLEKI